jgi:hypothetical protein
MAEPKTEEVSLVPTDDMGDEFKTVPFVGDLIIHNGMVYVVSHIRIGMETTRDQMGEGGSLQYNVQAEFQTWGDS